MSHPVEPASGSHGESARLELPLVQDNGSFCVCAWKQLEFLADGRVGVCCEWEGPPLATAGTAVTAREATLAEIWNSDDMRDVRRRMVEGRKVAGCRSCYEREEAGGLSVRLLENSQWEAGNLNEELLTVEDLKTQAAASDFRLAAMPERFSLHVGNLCNLKCRMCGSHNSTRIARDPVHSQWAARWADDGTRPPEGELWLKDARAIRSALLAEPGRIRNLQFAGGEPLLIKEIADVLQHLVDVGVSHQVLVTAVTNASTTQARMLSLADQFQRLELVVSIDGFEDQYEYIRYPARWDALVRNIAQLRSIPNTSMSAHVTVQNYNVLRIVDLFRYLDEIDLSFGALPLVYPPFLSPRVMPPRARQVAAERIRAYAESECKPESRDSVLGILAELEPDSEEFSTELVRDFMLFTNDLDVSRSQDFRKTHRELLEFILETGFAWTEETRHAHRREGVSLPVSLAQAGGRG